MTFAGFQGQDEVKAWLRRARLFVLPSTEEGQGVVLLEAMACGALIVGSRTPPLEEVIQHGHNGLLVDYFNGEELAACVDEVLSNLAQHEALRRNARRTIQEKYSLRQSLTRQLALMQALAANVI